MPLSFRVTASVLDLAKTSHGGALKAQRLASDEQ